MECGRNGEADDELRAMVGAMAEEEGDSEEEDDDEEEGIQKRIGCRRNRKLPQSEEEEEEEAEEEEEDEGFMANGTAAEEGKKTLNGWIAEERLRRKP
jgi:hypothetical protein